MIVLQSFANVQNAPQFLIELEKLGLIDVILPFLLIFTVLFTVLRTSKVLGDRKNIQLMIALTISLLVVIPHVMGTYPPGQDVVVIINSAIPNIALVVVVIISALLLAGIFVPDLGTKLGGAGAFLAFIAVGLVVYIFGLSAGWWEAGGPFGFLANPDIQAVLVIVLVFGLIIWLITAEKSPFESIADFVKRGFGPR